MNNNSLTYLTNKFVWVAAREHAVGRVLESLKCKTRQNEARSVELAWPQAMRAPRSEIVRWIAETAQRRAACFFLRRCYLAATL